MSSANSEAAAGFPPESDYTDPANGTDALVAEAITAAKARTGPVPVKAPLHPTYLASRKAKEQSVSQVIRLPGDMSAPPPIPLFNVDVWIEVLSYLCVERESTDMDAVCSDRKAFCALARTCRGIRWIFDGESTWLSAFLTHARVSTEKASDPKIAEIADKFNAALCVADLRAIRSMVSHLPHRVLKSYNGHILEFASQLIQFGQPKRIMQNSSRWLIIHVFRAEVYAKHIASKPGHGMTFSELGHQILRVEKKEPRNPTPEEIQASYKQDPENPWQMIACLDLLVELGMCDPSFDCIVLRACERTDPTWPQSLREVYLKALIDVRGYNVNKATPASGWTPLHEAVQLVDPWLANFLLERGADPHKPLIRKFDDVFGLNTTPREAAQTIHHQQASEQSAAVLAVFRRHGIDVD